jgi:hypothetical protein
VSESRYLLVVEIRDNAPLKEQRWEAATFSVSVDDLGNVVEMRVPDDFPEGAGECLCYCVTECFLPLPLHPLRKEQTWVCNDQGYAGKLYASWPPSKTRIYTWVGPEDRKADDPDTIRVDSWYQEFTPSTVARDGRAAQLLKTSRTVVFSREKGLLTRSERSMRTEDWSDDRHTVILGQLSCTLKGVEKH